MEGAGLVNMGEFIVIWRASYLRKGEIFLKENQGWLTLIARREVSVIGQLVLLWRIVAWLGV